MEEVKENLRTFGKIYDRENSGVAGFKRNRWQVSAGIGGRFGTEWVAGLARNTHFLDTQILMFSFPTKFTHLLDFV
jgi:hypothetical protein